LQFNLIVQLMYCQSVYRVPRFRRVLLYSLLQPLMVTQCFLLQQTGSC